MTQTLHEVLSDPNLSFLRKLEIAAASELVFWEDRHNPPNLSVHEFKRILPLIAPDTVPSWEPRKSAGGKYGATGEKRVFKFDFEISIFGKAQTFFLKGFFFEMGNLRGVEIQSFRREVL